MAMRKSKLRIIFFGERGSTFSLLHYAVLKRQANVLLWVTSHIHSSGMSQEREAFQSVRDWWDRFQVRASLEWQVLVCLGKPLAVMQNLDCPVRPVDRVDASLTTDLANLNADLLISAGFNRILPPAVLGIPKVGAFNCHPSPLPRYAGSNPWFWILRGGESESAVTIHRMIAEADAGPIVRQKRFPVPVAANHQKLYNYSSLQSALLLGECLKLWTEGVVEEKPQDLSDRSFFSAPKHKDYRIDWAKNAREIQNLVRASSPSPGAWTMLGGRQFAVRDMERASSQTRRPGDIVEVNRNGLYVSCGDGVVRIRSISLGDREIRGAAISRALQGSTDDQDATYDN